MESSHDSSFVPRVLANHTITILVAATAQIMLHDIYLVKLINHLRHIFKTLFDKRPTMWDGQRATRRRSLEVNKYRFSFHSGRSALCILNGFKGRAAGLGRTGGT